MDAMQSSGEQATLWNGPGGRAWVEGQDLLDHMFEPFERLLVEAVTRAGARQVLDIGCGTGATTLAVAQRLGDGGHCVGVDISQPMIAVAQARAEQARVRASFITADAQVHRFDRGSADMIISRFGVMFFSDPVRAFENLLAAARPGAPLRLIAWRSAEDNPFMTTAERAAAPLLPNLPARQPDGPGQFAFGNRDRVHAVLHDSGWADLDIEPVDVHCSFPAKELVRYLTRLGPVGLALQDADNDTHARVINKVRPAFAPYVQGEQVRFSAACWSIEAHAP